jgi:hypothetical protein
MLVWAAHHQASMHFADVPRLPMDSLWQWYLPAGWMKSTVAGLFILIAAYLLNALYNRIELYNQPVYLPGIIAIFSSSFFWAYSGNITFLLSSIFLIASLFFYIQAHRQKRISPHYFFGGLMMGTGICMDTNQWPLIVFVLMYLGYSRAFSFKETALAMLSLAIPVMYYWFYLYWAQRWDEMVWYRNPTMRTIGWGDLFPGLFWMTALSLLWALASLLRKEDRQTTKTIHSKVGLFLFFLFQVASTWLPGLYGWSIPYGSMMVSVTLLLAHFWTNYRFSLLAPFLFYGWLISCALYWAGMFN